MSLDPTAELNALRSRVTADIAKKEEELQKQQEQINKTYDSKVEEEQKRQAELRKKSGGMTNAPRQSVAPRVRVAMRRIENSLASQEKRRKLGIRNNYQAQQYINQKKKEYLQTSGRRIQERFEAAKALQGRKGAVQKIEKQRQTELKKIQQQKQQIAAEKKRISGLMSIKDPKQRLDTAISYSPHSTFASEYVKMNVSPSKHNLLTQYRAIDSRSGKWKQADGSEMNVAKSRIKNKLLGGSDAEFQRRREAEIKNREKALQQSAGLRASGQSGVGTRDFKAEQNFQSGYTPDTKEQGYSTTGQAEVERQKKVKEQIRQKQVSEAISNPVKSQKTGSGTSSDPFVAQQPDKSKVSSFLKGAVMLGAGVGGVTGDTGTDRYVVETPDGKKRTFKDKKTADKFIARTEGNYITGSMVGFSPSGESYQGPARPTYQITDDSGKTRTFLSRESAEKFSQRTAKPVDTPTGSLQYIYGQKPTTGLAEGTESVLSELDKLALYKPENPFLAALKSEVINPSIGLTRSTVAGFASLYNLGTQLSAWQKGREPRVKQIEIPETLVGGITEGALSGKSPEQIGGGIIDYTKKYGIGIVRGEVGEIVLGAAGVKNPVKRIPIFLPSGKLAGKTVTVFAKSIISKSPQGIKLGGLKPTAKAISEVESGAELIKGGKVQAKFNIRLIDDAERAGRISPVYAQLSRDLIKVKQLGTNVPTKVFAKKPPKIDPITEEQSDVTAKTLKDLQKTGVKEVGKGKQKAGQVGGSWAELQQLDPAYIPELKVGDFDLVTKGTTPAQLFTRKAIGDVQPFAAKGQTFVATGPRSTKTGFTYGKAGEAFPIYAKKNVYWHGTDYESAVKIATRGFSLRKAGRQTKSYLQRVTKSLGYAKKRSETISPSKTIFLTPNPKKALEFAESATQPQGREQILFHGTTLESAKKILKGGFKFDGSVFAASTIKGSSYYMPAKLKIKLNPAAKILNLEKYDIKNKASITARAKALGYDVITRPAQKGGFAGYGMPVKGKEFEILNPEAIKSVEGFSKKISGKWTNKNVSVGKLPTEKGLLRVELRDTAKILRLKKFDPTKKELATDIALAKKQGYEGVLKPMGGPKSNLELILFSKKPIKSTSFVERTIIPKKGSKVKKYGEFLDDKDLTESDLQAVKSGRETGAEYLGRKLKGKGIKGAGGVIIEKLEEQMTKRITSFLTLQDEAQRVKQLKSWRGQGEPPKVETFGKDWTFSPPLKRADKDTIGMLRDIGQVSRNLQSVKVINPVRNLINPRKGKEIEEALGRIKANIQKVRPDLDLDQPIREGEAIIFDPVKRDYSSVSSLTTKGIPSSKAISTATVPEPTTDKISISGYDKKLGTKLSRLEDPKIESKIGLSKTPRLKGASLKSSSSVASSSRNIKKPEMSSRSLIVDRKIDSSVVSLRGSNRIQSSRTSQSIQSSKTIKKPDISSISKPISKSPQTPKSKFPTSIKNKPSISPKSPLTFSPKSPVVKSPGIKRPPSRGPPPKPTFRLNTAGVLSQQRKRPLGPIIRLRTDKSFGVPRSRKTRRDFRGNTPADAIVGIYGSEKETTYNPKKILSLSKLDKRLRRKDYRERISGVLSMKKGTKLI